MKIFKKVIFVVVGLIVLITIGLTVFLQVRKYNASSELIHCESSVIVKISVDDILIDVLTNQFTISNLFKGSSSSDSTEKKQDFDIGLAVPAYMYLFSLDENYSTFYTYQRLSDKDKFIDLILNQISLESVDFRQEGNYWMITDGAKKFNIIGNSTHVLIGLNVVSADNSDILKQTWDSREYTLEKVKSFESLQVNKVVGDVVVVNLLNSDNVVVNFHSGLIHATANVSSHFIKPNSNNLVRKMSTDDIFNAYLNFDVKYLLNNYPNLLEKNRYLKNILENNSFYGYADIQWKNKEVIQQDTVIVYDYDDNFEQIERSEVREEKVPFITASIMGGKELNDLFSDKLFYKITKANQRGYLVLSTSDQDDVINNIEWVESNNFLQVHYRASKLAKSYLDKIPKLIIVESIDLSGQSVELNCSKFEVDIKLSKSDVHSLVQLFQ